MKLSELEPGAVQGPKGYEELRSAYAQKGAALDYAGKEGANLAYTVASGANEASQTITRVQMADAKTKEAVQDAELKAKLEQKKNYTWDEVANAFGGEANIPPEITGQVSKDSQNIPGFLVNPHIYKKERGRISDEAAASISMPGWRDKYQQDSQAAAKIDTAQMQVRFQQEADHFEIAALANQVKQLTNIGKFKEAADLINASPRLDPTQRINALSDLKTAEGEYAMQVPLRGTNLAEIRSTIEGLESGANSFEVKDSDGRKIRTADVSGVNTDQRREKLRLLRNYEESLLKAGKEAQKHQYDANDRGLIIAIGSTHSLGGLLAIQREAYKNPERFSNSAIKYLHSVIESKQNVAFTREKAYGPTDENRAFVSFTNLAMKGGGNFIGPDGREWGDLQDINVAELAAAYDIRPERAAALSRVQKALNEKKPIPDASLRSMVNTTIEANGLIRDDDGSKETQEHKAALTLYAEEMVRQRNQALVAQPNGKPMTKEETAKFIHETLSDPHIGDKVTDGKGFFGGPREIAAPKLSGIPAQDLKVIAALRASLKNQYHQDPFGTTGPEVAEAWRRIKDTEGYVRDSDVNKKLKMKPEVVTRYAGEIEVQRETLTQQLRQDMGREPKKSEVVQEFFRQKFPKAGLRDPRASVAQPTENDMLTSGVGP